MRKNGHRARRQGAPQCEHCKRLATTPCARFTHSRRVQAKTRDGQRCSSCRGTSLGGELRLAIPPFGLNASPDLIVNRP